MRICNYAAPCSIILVCDVQCGILVYSLDFFQIDLVTGVCEADCVGHSGVLPHHPDWRLCPSCYCALFKLLLVLGPGGWICKSGWFQIKHLQRHI